MDGVRRCRGHGGKTPQAQKARRLQLLELQDAAIAKLARLMVSGSSDAIQLRAAEAILDRGGNPRATRVDATVVTHAQESRDLLVERLRTLRSERGEIEPPRPAPAEDVVDAEVVEEPASLVSPALAESAAEALAGRLAAMKAERAAAAEWADAEVAEREPELEGAEPEAEPEPVASAEVVMPPVSRRYGQGVRAAKVTVADLAGVLERARQG